MGFNPFSTDGDTERSVIKTGKEGEGERKDGAGAQ